MQYLLTEEEWSAVQELRERARTAPAPEGLANIAQKMARDMIDLRPGNGAPVLDVPHGCIHVKPTGNELHPPRQPGYCDRCPAQYICRLPKEWSK